MFFSHLKILVALYLICLPSLSHAVLLALPSGEKHHLVWERALVVYDSLSKQQTVIAEAGISGSPSQFAILVATPQVAMIDYTTTRIWKRLRPYTRQKETRVRSLKLSTYSFFWDYFTHEFEDTSQHKKMIDVFKSQDTQIHIQERALHEWLIKRGLVLTLEQALSVKKAYQEGFVITALLVRPPKKNKKIDIQETWTSTWLFTHEVHEPFYVSLFPSKFKFKLLDTAKKEDHQNTKKLGSAELKLAYLSDKDLRYQIENLVRKSRRLEKGDKERVVGQLRTLNRIEISELNNSLSGQNWSFNRRGVLSAYRLTAPLGLSKIYGVEAEKGEVTPLPAKQVEQEYFLAIPFEVLIVFLWGILFVFKRKNSF